MGSFLITVMSDLVDLSNFICHEIRHKNGDVLSNLSPTNRIFI